MPNSITIDTGGANTAAIHSLQADGGLDIRLRRSKHLNSIVKQDHRAVKRIGRPMLGFKGFRCAARISAGIEMMHRNQKWQMP